MSKIDELIQAYQWVDIAFRAGHIDAAERDALTEAIAADILKILRKEYRREL
jgi:hypothetical protein